jgi:type II secretory pathway component HofQ
MRIVLLAVATVSMFGLALARSIVQDNPDQGGPATGRRARDVADLNEKKVSLNLEEATLKDALKALFEQVSVNHIYVVGPQQLRPMSFSVKGVPFEGALVSILRYSNKAPLSYGTDAEMLFVLPAREIGTKLNTVGYRCWIDLKDVDIRYAIKVVMGLLGENYVLDQNIQGTVTLKRAGLSLQSALDELLKACKTPISYRQQDGTYLFSASKP